MNNTINTSNSKFWDDCYKSGNIGWDLGKPTPIFNNWILNQKEKYKICILGSGYGWDAINFALYGHSVTAVDFSKAAIDVLSKNAIKKRIIIDILHENIFNLDKIYDSEFDIVLEYTCFCAINPNDRSKYINIVSSILKDNGRLVAIFFPLDKKISEGGPPYGVDIHNTLILFNKYFNLEVIENSNLSIKPRLNREKFVILRKNGNSYTSK
tara:strand:+ start:63 stop:695 length:633 start_codon:yes stop_codon:yes gene_type:complete